MVSFYKVSIYNMQYSVFLVLPQLNGNGYPNYDQIVHWIDNNIIYNHAKEIYEQLNNCNRELSQSISKYKFLYKNSSYTVLLFLGNNQYFSGDLNSTSEGRLLNINKDVMIINCSLILDPSTNKLQNTCDTLQEFMKCLSVVNVCIINNYF